MRRPVVKLTGVARDFFDGKRLRRVLKKMDLNLYTGDFAVIAGPSGSGKTTLLTIIGLILKPSQGEIYVDDENVTENSENELATLRMRKFGFVFQQAELIPALDVLENILIATSIQGKRVKGPQREKALSILEQFGLDEYAHARPRQLSTGQKQRVAIARALINDPILLLCDEPTSALDVESSKTVLDTLKQLSLDENRGVVMVTHDPRVFPYADRMIKLEDGIIVHDPAGEKKRYTDEKVP
jgi:putative ABC transport system ATP-binding protein